MEDRIGQLRRIPLFSALSDEDIRHVAGLVKDRSHRPGSTVYRQGELDTSLYMVVSGRLRVWFRDERGKERVLNYLQAGDSFGEHSLLTGERRDVTVDVEQAAVLVYLEKGDFDSLLDRHPHLREALSLRQLASLAIVPLFEKLSTEDMQRIAARMGRTHYRQGSVICRQGELSSTFYIIESGKVAVLSKEETGEDSIITYLRDGEFFGQRSLLLGEPRDTSVQSVEDTSLFYLNKRDLDQLLEDFPSIREALNVEADVRGMMLKQRLPWQREGEVLATLSYKHTYAFVRSLWLLIFPVLALAAILALAPGFDWAGISLYIACTLVGASALALLGWQFIDWRNDYYAVTNKRVVHVEKTIFLRESRSEAPLESIQDIYILMPSVVGRLLHFNDLSIQTAGAKGKVVFKTIGNAAWVRDKIFEQLEGIKTEERGEERDAIRRKLELELGLVEGEAGPTVEHDQVPTTAEPQVSPTVPRETTLLTDLLGAFRSYVLPQMRLEENGIVTWRKHWFRLIEKIAGPFLLLFMLVQLGTAAFLDLLSPAAGFESCFRVAILVGVPIGLFLLWYRYEDWRNDVYQLTDDRIIDLERLPLGLREERREASLAMIQDIGYEIPGVIANMLDYGNVVIETAGSEAAFTFSWVHQPRRVQEEVFARLDAFRERERQQQSERRAQELLDWFATYTDLSGEQERKVDETGE